MDLLIFIGLMVLGICLVVVEVLIVPGTTVVGIAGLILVGIGNYYVYNDYGTLAGHYSLGINILVIITLTILGFRRGAWEMFALEDTVEGKVQGQEKENGLKVKRGDEGWALTPLKPWGKAMINEKKLEVQAQTHYIDKDQRIKVIKVNNNTIIVKPINPKS